MFREYYDTYIILYSTRETFVLCLVQFDKKYNAVTRFLWFSWFLIDMLI